MMWTARELAEALLQLQDRGACAQPGRWQVGLDVHLEREWSQWRDRLLAAARKNRKVRDPESVVAATVGDPFYLDGITLDRAMTTDVPHPERKDRAAAQARAAIGYAKQVCGTCQVRTLCAARGFAGDESGVWGGMTEVERDEARAAGRRGTPRAG